MSTLTASCSCLTFSSHSRSASTAARYSESSLEDREEYVEVEDDEEE
jgi:hypothetical protein